MYLLLKGCDEEGITQGEVLGYFESIGSQLAAAFDKFELNTSLNANINIRLSSLRLQPHRFNDLCYHNIYDAQLRIKSRATIQCCQPNDCTSLQVRAECAIVKHHTVRSARNRPNTHTNLHSRMAALWGHLHPVHQRARKAGEMDSRMVPRLGGDAMG